jgi:hypothetical protein
MANSKVTPKWRLAPFKPLRAHDTNGSIQECLGELSPAPAVILVVLRNAFIPLSLAIPPISVVMPSMKPHGWIPLLFYVGLCLGAVYERVVDLPGLGYDFVVIGGMSPLFLVLSP